VPVIGFDVELPVPGKEDLAPSPRRRTLHRGDKFQVPSAAVRRTANHGSFTSSSFEVNSKIIGSYKKFLCGQIFP
jgi:hypothetical protein